MSRLTRWMDRVLYPRHSTNWDDQLFREIIAAHLAPDSVVLDLGAGAGIVPQMNFRGLAGKICGLDPDPRVAENPYLDEAKEGLGDAIPYADNTFDVVFADNVLEHLEHPDQVFSEVSRVLKPGGIFLTKTPNRNHYVPLISRCTPHWFHQWVNKLRGRESEDTFPTFYKANTRRDTSAWATRAGLESERIRLFEGRPEYLRSMALPYLAGWTYERAVNLLPGLSRFRVIIVSELRKPDSAAKPQSSGNPQTSGKHLARAA